MTGASAARAAARSAESAAPAAAASEVTGPASPLASLHRTAGNAAVGKLVRALAEPSVPPSVRTEVQRGGQPLDPAVRADMEHRMGEDLSTVRVHADVQAGASARAAGAHAYTFGDHVVFDADAYAPSTPSGRMVLAHEFAHVIQQRRGGPSPPLNPAAAHESEAKRAMSNGGAGAGTTIGVGTGIGLARITPEDLSQFLAEWRRTHPTAGLPKSPDAESSKARETSPNRAVTPQPYTSQTAYGNRGLAQQRLLQRADAWLSHAADVGIDAALQLNDAINPAQRPLRQAAGDFLDMLKEKGYVTDTDIEGIQFVSLMAGMETAIPQVTVPDLTIDLGSAEAGSAVGGTLEEGLAMTPESPAPAPSEATASGSSSQGGWTEVPRSAAAPAGQGTSPVGGKVTLSRATRGGMGAAEAGLTPFEQAGGQLENKPILVVNRRAPGVRGIRTLSATYGSRQVPGADEKLGTLSRAGEVGPLTTKPFGGVAGPSGTGSGSAIRMGASTKITVGGGITVSQSPVVEAGPTTSSQTTGTATSTGRTTAGAEALSKTQGWGYAPETDIAVGKDKTWEFIGPRQASAGGQMGGDAEAAIGTPGAAPASMATGARTSASEAAIGNRLPREFPGLSNQERRAPPANEGSPVRDADAPRDPLTSPGPQDESPIEEPEEQLDPLEVADDLPEGVKRMTLEIRSAHRMIPIYLDPRTNTWKNRWGRMQADHFVPVTYIVNTIIGKKRIKQLTPEQITELLTDWGNFQALPAPLNYSKAGILPSRWTTYKGEPINPRYRIEARKFEHEIIAELQRKLQRFIAINRAKSRKKP